MGRVPQPLIRPTCELFEQAAVSHQRAYVRLERRPNNDTTGHTGGWRRGGRWWFAVARVPECWKLSPHHRCVTTECVSSVEEMRVGIRSQSAPRPSLGQRGSSVAPEVGVGLKEPAWPLACARWTCPPAAHIYRQQRCHRAHSNRIMSHFICWNIRLTANLLSVGGSLSSVH